MEKETKILHHLDLYCNGSYHLLTCHQPSPSSGLGSPCDRPGAHQNIPAQQENHRNKHHNLPKQKYNKPLRAGQRRILETNLEQDTIENRKRTKGKCPTGATIMPLGDLTGQPIQQLCVQPTMEVHTLFKPLLNHENILFSFDLCHVCLRVSPPVIKKAFLPP